MPSSPQPSGSPAAPAREAPVTRVEAVRRFLGSARRLFPLKASGLFLLAGAGLLLRYFGFGQQDLILLMASLVLLVVACLCILLVCETAWATHRWWKRVAEQLPAELSPLLTGVPGRLRLAGRPPWRPLVEVNWRWLQPGDVESRWTRDLDGEAFEEFVFHQRGTLEEVVREFEIADVLGFGCIRLRYTQKVKLQVLPAPLPLDRSAFVTSFHAGEDVADLRGEPVGDRVDMRQYAAGDPPKLLLWKLYARTGKLMVRIPERAVAPTPRTCAYLVAGAQDEPVAGLLRSILESGLLGTHWRFGADGNEGYCETVEEALAFLARSGNLSRGPARPSGLRGFLTQAARDGFHGCLVGLPPVPGPWVEEIRQAARVAGIQVSWAAAPGHWQAAATPIKLPDWWVRVLPWLVSVPPHQRPGEPETVLQSLAGIGKERWLYQPARHGFVRFGGKLG